MKKMALLGLTLLLAIIAPAFADECKNYCDPKYEYEGEFSACMAGCAYGKVIFIDSVECDQSTSGHLEERELPSWVDVKETNDIFAKALSQYKYHHLNSEAKISSIATLMNTDYFRSECSETGKEKRWSHEEVEDCFVDRQAYHQKSLDNKNKFIVFWLYLSNMNWPYQEPYICGMKDNMFFENDRGDFLRAESVEGIELCDLIDSEMITVRFPCPKPDFYKGAKEVRFVINGLNGATFKYKFKAYYVQETTCNFP
ncbi:MAG: hypothetical protein ABIH66_07240 [bacterium]